MRLLILQKKNCFRWIQGETINFQRRWQSPIVSVDLGLSLEEGKKSSDWAFAVGLLHFSSHVPQHRVRRKSSTSKSCTYSFLLSIFHFLKIIFLLKRVPVSTFIYFFLLHRRNSLFSSATIFSADHFLVFSRWFSLPPNTPQSPAPRL